MSSSILVNRRCCFHIGEFGLFGCNLTLNRVNNRVTNRCSAIFRVFNSSTILIHLDIVIVPCHDLDIQIHIISHHSHILSPCPKQAIHIIDLSLGVSLSPSHWSNGNRAIPRPRGRVSTPEEVPVGTNSMR